MLEGISDDDAWVYVVETNTMQRSFAEMAHSEKAAVITLHHSKMFSQGKRNDILRALELLETPHGDKKNKTVPQFGEQSHTDKHLASQYGLSKTAVARYLRIGKLSAELKGLLDGEQIGLIAAVEISFLRESEQTDLAQCLALNAFSLDIVKAKVLREHSEKGRLDADTIFLILSGELGCKHKHNRTPTVKVAKAVYSKYFRDNQSAREVQSIVEAALALYFTHNMNEGEEVS